MRYNAINCSLIVVHVTMPGVDDVLLVPPTVRAKALDAGAQAWLDDLPALVAALEAKWSLTVGRAYGDATEAFVAEATLADGTPAVLKLLVPRAGNAAAHEITVLRMAGGAGCAALLRADPAQGALLLERLGPALADLGAPLGRRLEILCDLASAVWRPAPGCGLPTGAEKGRLLAAGITRRWAELGRPCTQRTVDHALDCAARRIAAHHDHRAVVVHGDVHQWNALRSGDGFKLVDPDGLLAEPEYDLGVLMREDPVELMAGDPWDRARWLAMRTGLDPVAIFEWGVVERVSTGLLLTVVGLQPVAAQMLAAADAISSRAA
jgi:streptomycin 6-kinase